jgi:phosphopantothenoylcysteine synthetase/decarboxylase
VPAPQLGKREHAVKEEVAEGAANKRVRKNSEGAGGKNNDGLSDGEDEEEEEEEEDDNEDAQLFNNKSSAKTPLVKPALVKLESQKPTMKHEEEQKRG